ncbi:MAG: PfkB family carbohydrate kinase [Candidatus Diapherotrites archaeon]
MTGVFAAPGYVGGAGGRRAFAAGGYLGGAAGGRRVFAIGDMNLDVLCELGKQAAFGEEAALRGITFSLGGNAANFAYAAALLGVRTELVSAAGNDFTTKFLEGSLRAAGVELNPAEVRGQNGCSVIMVGKKGERAIYSIKGALGKLTSKMIGGKILPRLRAGDIVYSGGYFHLRAMRKGFAELLGRAKRAGCVTALDLCYDEHGEWKIKHMLKCIDMLFLNEVELGKVAKGKGHKEKIKHLIRSGARCVVLKEGGKGATLYSAGAGGRGGAMRIIHEEAVRARALDTTAAGDVFNAGFIYGKINGWSERNCLRIGNFVAGTKVARHGLAVPRENEILKYMRGKNLIQFEAVKGYGELSKRAAELIIGQVNGKPESVIGIPAGGTPSGTYAELVKAHRAGHVDFSKAKFFGIDEYAGLAHGHRNSFACSLMKNFLGKVNARKENVFLFDGSAKELKAECARFENFAGAHGIDLILLGIGRNGHIAFNEPGTNFKSKTRIVELSGGTIKANKRFFEKGERVPRTAITIGLETIMRARAVVLMAGGREKAAAMGRMAKGKPGEKCPASILQKHRNAVVIADRASSGRIRA